MDDWPKSKGNLFYNDLEIKLLIDEEEAKADYKKSGSLKKTTSYRWNQLLFTNILR
jgi:hypothetical protein